jgi:ribosomal-protein-alanine N-acetyltransferase
MTTPDDPSDDPFQQLPVSPLQGWSLRPATEDDLPRVLELERLCHPEPGNAWTEENLRAELLKPYGRFLVLTDDETDERISGYIVFWMMFDECHILNVAVDPEHRRRGIGRCLVRRAVGESVKKDFRKILLDVRKSNVGAAALYQGAGFVITHIRKGFYSNGEDAYQMALYMDTESDF